MNIVFVSNYYNHHQSELSKALYHALDGQYVFIQTMPMAQERIELGWEQTLPPYVLFSYESQETYEHCIDLINTADVVIFGSAPENMLRERLKTGKLVFRYSERIFKKKDFDILRWLKYSMRVFPYRNKSVYYLCSSAYAAGDYCRCGAKRSKCYKWGYFPEVKKHEEIEKLIDTKAPASILWVARLLNWKHPERAVELASRLKADGYDFSLKIIGSGYMEKQIRDEISARELGGCVKMLGAMKPEQVRAHMEESEMFLFTSDRNEGWGAVLNESMNSACVAIASHAIGSVPFLLQDGENGLIYKDGDVEDLYQKTKWALEHHDERKRMAENAYHTMMDDWNADEAAQRLLQLIDSIENKKTGQPFEVGVCSLA